MQGVTMEDQKYVALTEAKITTMQHSFLCEDVRQALKQCKPPTDFHLVETHLAADQKPCAPKYTSADLSLLPEMLAPQRRASVRPPKIEQGGASRSLAQPNLSFKEKEPMVQRVTQPRLRESGSGEMQEGLLGRSSVSGSSMGTPDLPGMVAQPREVASQSRRYCKENVSEHQPRKVRPQTPDVPAFLKKFIQQKRDQQKRELRESNRDLSSSISLPLSIRRAGRSALPRPARSCEEESASDGSYHRPRHDWKAGREQGTPSCLPQSPFKMKSLSMGRRVRDGENLDDGGERMDHNGCFGPHGARLKKKVIPSPSPRRSPPQSSGSTKPLADKWQSRSSRRRKQNREHTNENQGNFSVSRESLVAGLAGLKKVEDGNVRTKRTAHKPGNEGSRERKDAPPNGSFVDFRESLCNEIRNGVQLRRVATVPSISRGREAPSRQESRPGGGLSDELKKRVMTLRASMRQDSDSSDDDRGWD
ncbi:hypothetical protein BSKO_01850 [Bryopsis sp. KO-2023]|nr:hypothetical protein BSKO_01850 [Bryopsis sp. KO-2023]